MVQTRLMFLTAALAFTMAAQGQAPARGRGQQPPPPPQGKEDSLDPSPINPAVDPNIDLFLNDWRNSKPRTMYGQLVFRDILSKLEGPDKLHPARRGAVLLYMTAISYATLQPGAVASGKLGEERHAFYTAAGSGEITVNSKSFALKEGSGFTLQPGSEFKMTSEGKEPLAFYVRTDPTAPGNLPPDALRPVPTANQTFNVTQRADSDRRIGIHWAHIPSGGLITIAPRTIPQPHSHYNEEIWLMVKGETILSLGKNLRRMTPGQAFKIPPTGITAHSNINMGEEPVQMMVFIPNGRASEYDYAQLEGSAFDPATAPDVDMFMGNWHDAFPRIMHGNLYFRDMLTALQGADPVHPTRKGAVLVNSEAVSYAMLEPGSTAHPIEGQLKGIQQTFVVNSGNGSITSGGKTVELAKDMSFILTPGLEFSLKATGKQYMTFYVVSEKLPAGFTPKLELQIADHRTTPRIANSWVNQERPIIISTEGLSQYKQLTSAEIGPMTMSRPYSVAPGGEEIWIATDGDIDMLFGKQLRKLPAGTAYRVPSTGLTPHAKINVSGKPARFIYMAK